MVFDNFFQGLFGWAINWNPVGGLLVICFILTLFITLVYKFMTDQKLLKTIKSDMKDLRKKMKEFRSDPKKMMELNKISMEKSMQQMKNTFKPMLVTFIPLILIFGWLREQYTLIEISFLGIKSWLFIYIVFSIVFSMFLRKIMKVY
jgi:uncharacterized membrane protein (DUF106 family)